MRDRAFDKLYPLIRGAINDELFCGAVIRVEQFGQALFEQSWGYAVCNGSFRIFMEAVNLFDLASLSKIFTSTAVLRLISKSEIEINTGIVDLLEFKNPTVKRALAKITISSLLDHSSGIHYWFPFYTMAESSFEEVLALILEEYPLSDHVIYSDINFMLLGLCLEKITDKTFPKAMQDILFDPLKLSNTTYSPVRDRTVATEFGNRIEQQMVADLGLSFSGWRNAASVIRGECNDGNCYYYFGGAAGHAGIFADAADVAHLGNIYANQKSEEFLSYSVLKAATKKRVSNRGLGFQFGDIYPQNGFGHTGFTGTYLYINPFIGVTITILTNRLHVPHPKNINSFRKEIVENILAVIK